jgi:hypothetical protein
MNAKDKEEPMNIGHVGLCIARSIKTVQYVSFRIGKRNSEECGDY